MINSTVFDDLIMPGIAPQSFDLFKDNDGKDVYGLVDGDHTFTLHCEDDFDVNVDSNINIYHSNNKDKIYAMVGLRNEKAAVSLDLYPFFYHCDLGKITQFKIISGYSYKGVANRERTRLSAFLIPEMNDEGKPELLVQITIIKFNGDLFESTIDLVDNMITNNATQLKLKKKIILEEYRDSLRAISSETSKLVNSGELEVHIDKEQFDRAAFILTSKVDKELFNKIMETSVKFNAESNPLMISRLGLKNVMCEGKPTLHYKDMLIKLGLGEMSETLDYHPDAT